MTQRDALNILKTGKNVFITGPAGSGKTYVVNEYIKYLKDHDVSIGVTASTGIAATHMGGVTIHSWSGIGINDRLGEDDLEEISQKSYVRKKIEDAKVLIVDEVSMLHHFRLDLVNRVMKKIKKSEEPFGGLQVVLSGDFFQLPPVSRMGDPDARFIYTSDSWKEAGFVVCYLEENYRQTDDASLYILNEIRGGEVSDGAREQLAARYNKRTMTGIEPTRLFTHNVDVDTVNDTALSKVDSPEFLYEMRTKGRKPLVEALKKSCLAPEFMRLRKGARVMCVKNNFEQGYVNGTLGVVISCGPGVAPIIRTAANPQFPDGRTITIEPAIWRIEDGGRVLAELEQYPLRLAWAITVHKSQGMSLDAVEVDLSKSFEPGMGYVALSRVRTLNGLTILGMNENALKVHPEVLEYDRHLRMLSGKAESVVSHADSEDLQHAQDEFLAKVAPLHSIGKKGKKGKVKLPKTSTIAKTARFILEKKSLKDIANDREMTVETIINHIEELVANGAMLSSIQPESEAGNSINNYPAPDINECLRLSDIAYLKYDISPQHFGKIEKALEKVASNQKDGDWPLLSPVKTIVGPNISFKEIRLARTLLGYRKKLV